jgi:hypothetical protein
MRHIIRIMIEIIGMSFSQIDRFEGIASHRSTRVDFSLSLTSNNWCISRSGTQTKSQLPPNRLVGLIIRKPLTDSNSAGNYRTLWLGLAAGIYGEVLISTEFRNGRTVEADCSYFYSVLALPDLQCVARL